MLSPELGSGYAARNFSALWVGGSRAAAHGARAAERAGATHRRAHESCRGRSGRAGSACGVQQELQQLGWIDGRNARIDIRWGAGDAERYRTYAAELVALAPDVILAATSAAVLALKRTTPIVPIVFVGVIDPVGSGLVASLARPGGNATGFTLFEYAIAAKWLELVKEIAPGVTRVAVLRDPTIAAGIGQFAAVQTVAPMNIELSAVGLQEADEIEQSIAGFAHGSNGGLS